MHEYVLDISSLVYTGTGLKHTYYVLDIRRTAVVSS